MITTPPTRHQPTLLTWPAFYGATSVALALIGCLARLTLAAHPGRSLFEGHWLLAAFLLPAAAQICLLPLPFILRSLSGFRVRSGLVLCTWLIVLLVARTDSPLIVRVLISQPWLRPAASRVLSEQSVISEDRRVGLFRISNASVQAGVVYLSTGACGFIADCGLVYVPSGHASPDAAKLQWYSHEHLYGPWWRYIYED